MDKVQQARERLKAAQLRTRAAHMDDGAEAYERQATHPIYPGQESICLGKAGAVRAMAAERRAEAELIEARAMGAEGSPAPELLEALKWAETYFVMHSPLPEQKNVELTLTKIKQAIAKAEGRGIK